MKATIELNINSSSGLLTKINNDSRNILGVIYIVIYIVIPVIEMIQNESIFTIMVFY
jgi:hypothetical protein